MNRSKPPPPPPTSQPPVLLDITVTPLRFPADARAGDVVASVLVETRDVPFTGTLALGGLDAAFFGVADRWLMLTQQVPPGQYYVTIIAEQGNEALHAPQVLTAIGAVEPGPEPEPEPPPTSADNTMTLLNVSGAVVVDYPLQFGRAFVQGEIANYAEIVLDGEPLATQCDVKNRWGDGSVKFAVIAAVVPSLLPGVSSIVQFVNTASSNNAPSNLSSVPSYDARIVLNSSANGGTAYASARNMLEAGAYSLWTSGPIAQTYVCCDRTAARIYDMGWSSHRAFHPWFVVTVWPTLGKVYTRFVGEIGNTEAMEAQSYTLDLTVGEEWIYTQHNIAHLPGSRWSRAFWHGDEPEPKVNLYHNIAYLAQTGLVPNYDPAVVIPASTSETKYTNWLSISHAIGAAGFWQPAMGTTGGRLDIGLNPSWNVSALMSGDWRDREVMLGQTELANWWRRIIREGDPAKANLGRTIHCHTRGSYWFLDDRGSPTVEDDVVIIDPGVANGWQSDVAHHPDPFSLPYIMTGCPYWLDSLEMWHGANSLLTQPAYRNYNHMTTIGDYQVRSMAWIYRTMVNAAALLPDADALKPVFSLMVDEAVAYDEGVRGINTTEFSGNVMHAYGASGLGTTGDGWHGFGPPPCRWWSGAGEYYATDPAYYNTDITWGAAAHWMNNFVIAALGRGRELGFPVDALVAWVAPNVIGQFGTVGYPPQLASQYNVPDTRKVSGTSLRDMRRVFDDGEPGEGSRNVPTPFEEGITGAWFVAWEEALTGWSAQKQSGILDGAIEMVYWGQSESYYNKARCALSFVTDQPGGEEAWARCEETIAAKTAESGYGIDWSSDPTWAVVARHAT